jgi:single-stranded-DNA-specific exonuclease
MRQQRWEYLTCEEASADALSSELGISPIGARLLVQRGFRDVAAAQRFLHPTLAELHDPFALTDMSIAVERILRAIRTGERIAIHGDYDADGITSTVLLRRALEMLGGKVVHYVPHRIKDGYGLAPETIERLSLEKVDVVVSADCGIRSVMAARCAREVGVDLIVTDHHEPDEELPSALAVINPKRRDCSYPDKNLAGVGVALKLVQALGERSGRQNWLKGFLKIAAIGTLADVVPLVGENRIIAKVGLEELSNGPHAVGLQALLDVAGAKNRTVDSFLVSFGIAPRLNAAGRMATPEIAVQLLLAKGKADEAEAVALAQQLDVENIKRRKEESDLFLSARRLVEKNPDIGSHNALVVSGEQWHRGVIGIVASRLAERFNKPTVVLSMDGDVSYGSGRSIPGFDLLSALEKCESVFMKFGGHRQAAGLTMKTANIAEFRSMLTKHADEVLSPDDLVPSLPIDGEMPFEQITSQVIEDLKLFEPFGSSNQKPVFAASEVAISDGPYLLKEKHLRMSVKQSGRIFRAVAWRGAGWFKFLKEHRDRVNIAFSLVENHFRGETTTELSIGDVQEPR